MSKQKLTQPFSHSPPPIPYYLFSVPYSLFPIPYSLFPTFKQPMPKKNRHTHIYIHKKSIKKTYNISTFFVTLQLEYKIATNNL